MQDNPNIDNSKDLNNNKDVEINLDDYIKQDYISEGSFSKVYKIKEKQTGEIYAAKISIDEIDDSNKNKLTDLMRELNIIAKLNHPSVLKFKGYSKKDFKKRPRPVIITEFANGTLEDLISTDHSSSSNSPFTATHKLIIIYGIASGILYLHEHGIIHRDLKPLNILIDQFLLPKISDFGLSLINHSILNSLLIRSDPNQKRGTPVYMSPEIWSQSEYSEKSDVWAFSMILYEIFTKEKPFNGFNCLQIISKLAEGYRPEIKVSIPHSYENLITSCWREEPSSRPSFKEIVDKLKTDRGFITEQVNEEEYFQYIKYIEEYKVSFDQSLIIKIISNQNCFQISKTDTNLNIQLLNEYFSLKLKFIPYQKFIELPEICKKYVIEADDNFQNQFTVGKFLIEGQELFPRWTNYGLKYLKESMKNNFIDAIIYYCEILIKGEIIHEDITKAKEILEKKIKLANKGVYYLLKGKISKKEGKYEEALNFFKESNSYENSESFYEYGLLLYEGKITSTINNNEVSYYFEKAISYGNTRAMHEYGQILIYGLGFIPDVEKGIEYIKMAADKGDPIALYQYSNFLETGYFVPVDKSSSFEYLKESAYKGCVSAMNGYACALKENKKDENSKKEAYLFIKKASEAGNMNAIYNHSLILDEGFVVPINHEESTRLVKIAADNGHTFAKYCYGEKLYFGNGVEPNRTIAAQYFKESADKGIPESMYYYGYMSDNGDGIPMNKEDAVKYYKKAIDYEIPEAMVKYARMLVKGDGIPVNIEEAIKYYKLAVKKGHAGAMNDYANLLNNGDEVAVNKKKSN